MEKLKKLTNALLGPAGRMICASKTGYHKLYPNNVAIFNANLVTKIGKKYKKFWYGDLDLTVDLHNLLVISKEAKKEIYVLYEMDARFDNEDKPNIDNYIMKISESEVGILDRFQKYFRFDDEGKKVVLCSPWRF